MAIDEAKLNEFMGRMIVEAGAAASAPLILIGDRLGLYKAMAGAGPLTPDELAERTGTDERYVREWLCNQAAGGFVTYDAGRFTLPDEQALALADETSPVFLPGLYETIAANFVDEPTITQAFRTGRGVGWHEHDCRLFHGVERFFRPGYNAHLVADWIPALDGVEARLRAGGARVADIGCGHGASTILMAAAYPESTFVGFDYHAGSIETARQRAAAGLADRISFEVASAKEFPGRGYDLVTVFDALHDMGDPVGAAAHVLGTLAPDGVWMIVEPFAGDRTEHNLNPVGRLFYAASTMICTPVSKSQEVGLALGAQAGEARLRAVLAEGGFTRFRRAAETPFNLVFEARP